MDRLKLISLSVLLLFISLSLTTAVPQWNNSTDGRRYFIEGEEKYNWFQASRECSSRGLQLVEIDTQQKNQALIAVLTPIFGNTHNLWLGANDEYNRDKNFKRPFYWTTSGKAMTFSHWSSDNPDNYRNNEHCVHTWKAKPNYQWNDVDCTARLGFICEDQYLKADYRKTLAEKQTKAKDIITKLNEEYSLQQRQQIEKFEQSFKNIENGESELKELIHNINTKLEFDITHALAQHQRELNSALEDRNKVVSHLSVEIRVANEQMDKKFLKELEKAKSVLDDIFSN